ncbi:MAG: prepilin-type N-terminal cleavage/methylation domain-containing protein, partial [Candidatus Saccharimonadales bacterium]
MLGGKNRRPLGYTIVEVMIVLAVSGVMFLIAANFINGKQARTAFSDGVNEMASQIQDTIQQVSDGKYSDIPLMCTFDGTHTSVVSGGSKQGTNSTCVFLGKLLRFGPQGTQNVYDTISLAGGRVDGGTVAGADPRVIDDLVVHQNLPQNLDVTNVKVNGGGSGSETIGFLQSQGSIDATSGSLNNGAQTIDMYSLNGFNTMSNLNHSVSLTNSPASLTKIL